MSFNPPSIEQLDTFIDVVDDKGMLFLANPDCLSIYLGEAFSSEDIETALIEAMEAGHLILWRTGRTWPYKLRLSAKPPPRSPVRSSNAWYLYVQEDVAVGSFSDLLLPIQYRSETLPVPRLRLPLGTYAVVVHRMVSSARTIVPEENFGFHTLPRTPAHYHVELRPAPNRDAWNSLSEIPRLD